MGVEPAEAMTPPDPAVPTSFCGGLLFAKANYFFLYGASSIVLPATSVFGGELGLGPASVGIVLTVVPFVVFLVRPLVGSISDRLQKIMPVLNCVTVLEAACLLLICAVPSSRLLDQKEGDLHLQLNLTAPNVTSSFLGAGTESCLAENFTNASSVYCSLACPCPTDGAENATTGDSCGAFQRLQLVPGEVPGEFYLITNKSEPLQSAAFDLNDTAVTCGASCSCPTKDPESITASEDMSSYQFWLFFLLTCLIRIAISSAFSLSDTACFQQLGERPQDYGLQRLWGTVGWGIMAPLSGLLIDFLNAWQGYRSYAPGFYLAVGLLGLQCLVGLQWRLGPSQRSRSIVRNVGRLLRQPRHLCFLLDIFVVGSCSSIHWYYVYWYLQELKATKLLMGLTLATQSFLGDLPFMFLSGWLIGKLRHINVVRLAFVGFFLKFLCYSYLHNPWWAIGIELLQGPTYGSFYVAMTSYARSISLPGTEATFLSIILGVFDCLGIAAGSCLGGLGIHYFDARTTYFIASFVPLVWLMLTVLLHQLISRCSDDKQGNVAAERPLESAVPFFPSKSSDKVKSDQATTEHL